MPAAKKILFVIASLEGGGAERVVCAMANYWAGKEREVTIVTFSSPDDGVAYPLSSEINLVFLDVLGKSGNAFSDNFSRIRKLRAAFKAQRPDVIVSFMETTNVLAILAARGLNVPMIVSDRIDPKFYSYGRVWRLLRNITYAFADLFVVQTSAVLRHYPAYLARKANVIPNPVHISADRNENMPRENIICAMGRLHRQKGFDILLRSYAKIADKFPDWTMKIWGEGEERQRLETLANELGISGQVSFPGFTNNTEKAMGSCRLFILPSRYEGFPNALLEAMAYGLPVISSDCPCGPKEIISNGQDGLLIAAEDEGSLSEAMALLLEDSVLRKNLGFEAQKIQDKYNPDRIIKMWEDLLCAV